MGKPVPPRLSFLLASEAPVSLIFRRGRSKLVQLIRWDREHDNFVYGSRFRGRIYVERSDISPDGRHFIYFAMGGLAWAIPETGGTWTAISRVTEVPGFAAATLWASRPWNGDGMFTSNRSYWVDIDSTTTCLRDESKLRRIPYRPKQSRHERDGWTITEAGIEKPLIRGWVLRRTEHGYHLAQPKRGSAFAHPAWEWADWDRTRLV